MALPLKFPVQKVNLVTNFPLTQGGVTIINTPFPLGEGYYTLLMDFKLVLTHGTGATPRADALLRALRDIMFKTDRDGIIFKAPARSLFRRATKIMGTRPYQDTFAAASATYFVQVPFHFANRRARRPEDTLLDTSRYRGIELHILLGSLADMLATVGTDTGVFTVDVSLEKTLYAVDATNAPIMLPYVMGTPAVIPDATTYMDIEKNPDMGMLDFSLFASNTNVIAGIPYSGDDPVAGTPVLTGSVSIYDNFGYPFRNIPAHQLQKDNKVKFSLETIELGMHVFDFIEDASALSAYATGDKSVLQVQWSAATASSQVVGLIDGVKRFAS